ncbi:hypothetical protein NN3_10600 [Nocardia neocaledoniensis NBRC 108232]|uniref:ADP-ribosylglycohydrolase n=1 Tax=Nocardia neocaledoniensis TaxID=236511 RepID=A0A317NF86_9NOCA|nr:ADP-ribosylglycohydrolase family protein [Nocardia neocaledoniensis]PWV73494.1 ADP-ribosylglycohydrolase [Nocardia neocaledoniensis]GEM30053.1 hypothetical protein NN3_10600 [Nocardia neocaledoniensis NBRC 108232]
MTTIDIANDSLDGLSVGDALGAQFFVPGRSVAELLAGRPPAGPWEWTDDTEMACSVLSELRTRGRIDPTALAAVFADRCEPYRGYSGGTVALLHQIRDGRPWAEAAAALFDGRGSWGNGAAMRVAPLGAFLAGDLDRAAAEAASSAEVTHAHPEAIVGAMAVAVAASHAANARGRDCAPGELAITACVEAGGDADTTAAIVGGIVAARTGIGGEGGVPAGWLEAREELPDWGRS